MDNDRGGPLTRDLVQVWSRWDDCDRHGHVNNAAYLALVRAAHDRAGLPAGQLRAVELVFRQPVVAGAEVDVDVAVLEDAVTHQRVAYRLSVEGRPAAEVTATWRHSGPAPRAALPPIDGDAGGRSFAVRHAVRSYEVGPDGAARPQAILQWLEHAVFRAATRAGWPRVRLVSAGFLTLVVGHQLVLGEPGLEDDELVISSRLVGLRRVSGTWHHEVHRPDGALVAADLARGAFLDLEGRVRPAPADLLRDLLAGEPSG